MPKPPRSVEAKARNIKTLSLSLPQASVPAQYPRARSAQSSLPLQQHGRSLLPTSSILSEQSQQQTTVPSLPPHLDKLIDQPWSKEASLLLDSWLWYIQREFELVGGEV